MRSNVHRWNVLLAMPWHCLVSILLLSGCTLPASPTATVPGPDAPFPPTWTPTAAIEATPTATLVVVPTPTWDGTPPPPSEAYVPRLQPGQLYRALQKGEAVSVVDTRNMAAFDQAHIPDAVHIPLEELGERVAELDGNKTIVFYCTSPNEAMSLKAAMDLYELGFTKVSVLDGGLQTWYAQGYPVAGQVLTPKPGVLAPSGTITPLAETPAAGTPVSEATATGTPPISPERSKEATRQVPGTATPEAAPTATREE